MLQIKATKRFDRDAEQKEVILNWTHAQRRTHSDGRGGAFLFLAHGGNAISFSM
jgi:hypothetical protein